MHGWLRGEDVSPPTVLHCASGAAGPPVLRSHLEALAMPPIHRASFPEALPLPHVERGVGGFVEPILSSRWLFLGVVCWGNLRPQGVLWGSVMPKRTSLVSTFL